jgi:hypothetical protein
MPVYTCRKAKNRAAPQLLQTTETLFHEANQRRNNKGESGLAKGEDSMLDSAI